MTVVASPVEGRVAIAIDAERIAARLEKGPKHAHVTTHRGHVQGRTSVTIPEKKMHVQKRLNTTNHYYFLLGLARCCSNASTHSSWPLADLINNK